MYGASERRSFELKPGHVYVVGELLVTNRTFGANGYDLEIIRDWSELGGICDVLLPSVEYPYHTISILENGAWEVQPRSSSDVLFCSLKTLNN